MQLHQSNRFSITVLVTSLCLLVLSHAAWAQSVQIENSSFEDPSVPDGTFFQGTPGWAWTGSDADGNGDINAIINPGGPSSAEPWPSTTPAGMDGSNFCKLFCYDDKGGGGILYQDTGIKYQAGKTYILTADFGLPAYQTLVSGGQMFLADSNLNEIAAITISAANLTSGAFTPQSVTYTATGNETGGGVDAPLGDIVIGFFMPVAPAQTYLDFDNVQLTVIPTLQPSSEIVQVGQTATLSAIASGSPPLSYQWRLNGVNISGATNATLSIPNAQLTNSGSYSVVVSNSVGPAATSQESKLTVYTPPIGPQPEEPTLTLTSLSLSAAQLQAPSTPTSSQLEVLNSITSVDPKRMTIVMTHGWNSSAADWPTCMGKAFRAVAVPGGTGSPIPTFDTNVNILAWDWSADAKKNSVDPSYAASRTLNQGRALGQALIDKLGASYNLPIHFIGHSLGALVNCEAANYIHGDNRSYGDIRPVYSASNTQMTLLDEAGDFVKSLLGWSINTLSITNGGDSTTQTLINKWADAVPYRSAWVDNYISEVGYLQSKAANVLLFRYALVESPVEAHSYAYNWYQETVSAPLALEGDAVSFERGTLTPSQPAAPEGTYFLQSLDLDAPDQLITQIEPAAAWHFDQEGGTMIIPNAAFQELIAPDSLVQNTISSAIQYSDNLTASIVQNVESLTGAPMYLDTSGSMPAYLTVPSYSNQSTNQATYGMQLAMQPPAVSANLIKNAKAKPSATTNGSVRPADASSSNAVYTIIPVTIPNEAVGVSFEYQMTGAADDDFMTMGVAGENDYQMEGAYVTSGAWNGTPLISVLSYHGQSTQLVFAMSGASGPPSGTLSVRNIKFIIPPRPQLSLAMNGTALTVSWPVTATDCTLQTTATLSDPNSWQTVSGAPVDTTLAHTMTLNVASQSQFFRLLK